MTDLYPILPDDADLKTITPHLVKILQHKSVSALRITAHSYLKLTDLTTLLEKCHHYDVALILFLPSLATLKNISFEQIDGFHLKNPIHLGELIKILPKKYTQQIGVTASNLDEAMLAGEAGADYISFAPSLSEHIHLWNQITELPSVAEPLKNEEEIKKSLHAGANFLGFTLNLNESDQEQMLLLEKLIESHD